MVQAAKNVKLHVLEVRLHVNNMCGGEDDGNSGLRHPTKLRRCTDILFLILFCLFWAGMVYITSFSLSHGDALRLVNGYDSYGNTCDQDNEKITNASFSGQNTKGNGFLFYMDVQNPFSSVAICVAQCPDMTLESKEDVQRFAFQKGSQLCRYDIPIEFYSDRMLYNRTGRGPCPKLPVPKSVPLLNRCVPATYLSTPTEVIHYINSNTDIFAKVLSDLFSSWRILGFCCLIAICFALLMVLLMRFLASVIVWMILCVSIISSIAGTAVLWWTYASFKGRIIEEISLNLVILQVDVYSEKSFLIYSIIATILTVILLFVIFIMRKRIRLVVELFQIAGKCLISMPCLLFLPIFTGFILFIFIVYWTVVLLYLSSAEIPSVNREGFVRYEEHIWVSCFWWYHLIALIWNAEFIIACQQFVISGSIARWYFTRDKGQVGCAICKSIFHLTFYHLGSIAFGSFIITLIKFPRLVLLYIHKKSEASNSSCAEYCAKCCGCCLWCLEKCMKHLNANAYTYIAIRGTNFCPSSKKAFQTLISNALRVAALNSIGDFVLLLGKIGITAATGAVAVVWLKSRADLHFYAIPVLLVCVFAYFIASCFLSVYEMAVDALLLCYCEDNNEEDVDEPFMNDSLHTFVEDRSAKLDALKRVEEPVMELKKGNAV